MMKKLLAFLLVLCMAFALAGCGEEKDSKDEKKDKQDVGYTDENNDDGDDEEDYDEEDYDEEENNYTPEPDTHIVSICRSFIATGCAQITDLDYDSYGYPSGGRYTCYCQACGKDLGGGGFGSTGAFGSKYCFDCKRTWQYSIDANRDTIEVED